MSLWFGFSLDGQQGQQKLRMMSVVRRKENEE